MTPVLEVNNLSKRYGDLVAVNAVSFPVNRQEVFGILGPNGAGKTTTLEMIETLRPLDSGSITLDGMDVTKQPQKVKQRIGVQLQSSSFFDKLSLTELLKLFGEMYGRQIDPLALLNEVELKEKAKSYVADLSGGQKQRFSIAAALVNDPVILFLDEPTTGLDPQARRHLWGVIKRIRSEGKTIVLTTHYMEEAEELCDRVAIMDSGKIIANAPPQELIRKLLGKGFKKERVERLASLEDVFLDLTGHSLRAEQ
ncbi:MAG: ABC transporter ATP-binding protein [Ignavibacteriae bacterium]|nr:ABC transporter ATP-binding protein [Ignavibacteriota bacterium]